MIVDRLNIFRFAIGRQAHDFVLTRIHFEAGVVSESRVEQTNRVGKRYFPKRSQSVAAASPRRRGCPFTNTMKTENSRILIWRWIERRRGVRFMVFGEKNLGQCGFCGITRELSQLLQQ